MARVSSASRDGNSLIELGNPGEGSLTHRWTLSNSIDSTRPGHKYITSICPLKVRVGV
jgi:hypothetical protein